MKDLKKTVAGQKAKMASVLADVQQLVDREKQTTDSTTKQLVKKLRRSASDTQIRYNRVIVLCRQFVKSILKSDKYDVL